MRVLIDNVIRLGPVTISLLAMVAVIWQATVMRGQFKVMREQFKVIREQVVVMREQVAVSRLANRTHLSAAIKETLNASVRASEVNFLNNVTVITVSEEPDSFIIDDLRDLVSRYGDGNFTIDVQPDLI